MTLLILGVLLWAAAHLLKRLAPGLRARLGEGPGKGLVTLALLVSLYLMVTGYRAADFVHLWEPPLFLRHVNNLLMVFAVILVTMQANRGRMQSLMRHPMLTGVKTWALAHLLVNGDLASVVLFGGMLAWAVVEVIVINRANRSWTRPAPGPLVADIAHVAGALVLMGGIIWLHGWLGYPAVGG
ncbi:NnrU family protein [Stagnihabitans tardus]|uniref:NnrU domain-containing protein n=1 Tax=Stagnihabitans tardus TaxID=2699202 RepID=A0AAE5BUW0_9RHOB|nr:NnrU family protein [Stagnihabitans tardus]NBZ87652.1 hypothetical protein [Stagnihabitans tardus]